MKTLPVILDGPVGTELERRGYATTLPKWSAGALLDASELVRAIHIEHLKAGADVLTTNTFRTRQATLGPEWRRWATVAVSLAQEAKASVNHQGGSPEPRIAGSVAPLADCYRPWESPYAQSESERRQADDEHRALCETLADVGCDLLLCETHCHPREALGAARAALSTGLPTWVALTPGPDATLMTPAEMAEAGKRLVGIGVEAVLVNCGPARETLRYVEALAGLPVAIGAYANAGSVDDTIGWNSSAEPGAQEYTELAAQWRSAGAQIIGSCCGTTTAHIAALRARWKASEVGESRL